MFYSKIPNSAEAGARMAEKQRKEKELQIYKERQQIFRENCRDANNEKYNQKNLEIAEYTKLLNDKTVKLTKISLWIGGTTLLVTILCTIFTILSYYNQN